MSQLWDGCSGPAVGAGATGIALNVSQSTFSGLAGTVRPSDRPTEHTPIRQVPTYPILCAVKATILGHILAPFGGGLGGF